MIITLAKKIMRLGYICDNCLGRQFALLLTGMSNKERGEAIRKVVAMDFDAGSKMKIDRSNFSDLKMFRRSKKFKKKTCFLCNGLFEKVEEYGKTAVEKIKNIDFETFVVGIKMSNDLIIREESLWEKVGHRYAESIKSEFGREVGKFIEKLSKKRFDNEKPKITITIDLERKRIDVSTRSVYIYGKYKKLVRGIPQTKWDKYEKTVEDIVARPFMKASGAEGHAFHGMGREDIDARCLDYRPFILELKNPKRSFTSLKKFEREINKSREVKVKLVKFSNKKEVAELKAMRPEKEYRVIVEFCEPVDESEVEKIKGIVGKKIRQRTPIRVLHRRKDMVRVRKIIDVKYKRLSKSTYEFRIRAEAGTYIKELVTGDEGRTHPSFFSLIGKRPRIKSLDVVKIYVDEMFE